MVNNRYHLSLYCLLSALILVSGCQKTPLQTVDSGLIILDENDPKYKFSRNQESSVNIDEPQYVAQTITDLGVRFLNQAYLRNETELNRAKELYNKGLYGAAPHDFISVSTKHQDQRDDLLMEIDELFQSICEMSGYYSSNPTLHRRREAHEGSSGLISNKLSSELIFADPKGLISADVFRYMMMGTIALDQIFNVHLSDDIIRNEAIISDHEIQKLLPGQNYTELEHHWDLAYGYYKHFWRPLATGDGLPALRGCLRDLDLAFTLGRIDINYHLYSELPKHVEKIRKILTKVLLIRIQEYLVGGNTISNLNEDKIFAFSFLSKGYGLLYSLMFINDAKGNPYFSYTDLKEMKRDLISQKGFWDQDKLLSDEKTKGSLKSIMALVSTRLQNSVQ